MKTTQKIKFTSFHCPFCQAGDVQNYKPPRKQPGTPGNFRIVGDKVCQRCGGVWSPPVPRWLALVTCFVGIGMVVALIGMIAVGFTRTGLILNLYESASRLILLAMSAAVLSTGIRACFSAPDEAVVRIQPPPKTGDKT